MVDAGPAQLLKVFIGQAQRKWLEDEENSERWYGYDSHFTAKDRRILITHWAAEAWNKLTSSEYEDFLWKAWRKTGCLITADGSEDELIKPERLPNYTVPPATLLDPTSILPETSDIEGADSLQEEDYVEVIEPPTFDQSEDLPEDCPQDRDYSHELVGRVKRTLRGWMGNQKSYLL